MTHAMQTKPADPRIPTLAYPAGDDEIDLAELFRALWQGRWLILGCGFLCTAIAVMVALWLPNIYRAEALLAPSAEQQGGVWGLWPVHLVVWPALLASISAVVAAIRWGCRLKWLNPGNLLLALSSVISWRCR